MPDTPTIESTLQQASRRLAPVAEAPRHEAEILLAHAMGKSRAWLRTWPERVPSAAELQHFEQMLTRRAAGEPVAYITGQRDFWDMRLQVTPDTLIPRPETERLVELALERIPPDARWHVADLGTGSGAIALAIARERPACRLIATDNSAAALRVARDNATRLAVNNIEFRHGRWLAPLAAERLPLIVSNPPYVHPTDLHLTRGDLRFEPAAALGSSPDGLGDIRHIAAEARGHLLPGGWLLLEHGYDQGAAVAALLRDLGYTEVASHSDLAGHDRVTLCRRAT